jgi:hypothetical protein
VGFYEFVERFGLITEELTQVALSLFDLLFLCSLLLLFVGLVLLTVDG